MSALANWYPGHSVLDFCVIAAATVILVTATAWMVSLFLKRHPAIRHWVLLSALVASLASPFLALGFIASGRSFINVPLLIAEDTTLAPELPDEVNPSRKMQVEHRHAASFDEPAQPVALETFLPTHRTGPAKAEAVSDNVASAEPKSPTVDATTGPSEPFRSAVVAVLLMWLCGTLVVILGLFRGVLFLRRLRQSVGPITDAELGKALDEARRFVGARSLPAAGVSSLARSPMVAGLFRPIIVIPRSLLGAIRGHQLRDILTHEIAHVERRDNLVVLLQAIAKAAFWPIPFMHLLNRELGRAREEICDNHVLACRDAVSYGETLLRVAHLACETEMPVGTVGILHWRGKLEDRIFGLVHKGRSKVTRMHPLIALGVLTLFLSASAILCGTTIIAAQPPQTATPGDDRVTESSDDDSRKAQDKRDQPPAAEAPVKAPQKQEQDKEAFTVWGEEVGGLQAGLGFRPGEQRAYNPGETVKLVVRVRNVSKENVKFQYFKEFLIEFPPTVTDSKGKPVSQAEAYAGGKFHVPVEVNLAPGKEIELTGSEPYFERILMLSPAVGTGKISVQYERVIGNSRLPSIKLDPALSKLATGKLELEIKSDPPPATEKKQADLQGVWDGEIVEFEGRQIADEVDGAWRVKLLIDGDRLTLRGPNWGTTLRSGPYVDNEFTFKVSHGVSPKEIDLRGRPGQADDAPRLVLGVYDHKEDVLRVCLGLENVKRPTELKTDRSRSEALLVLKRAVNAKWTPLGTGGGPPLTGKLELEIKSDPAPAAPEKKDPPQQDKEAFTAWGKEVGGLQAGLGYHPGQKRAYRHGETVRLVLRVRNVSKKEVEFVCCRQYFMEVSPTMTDGQGKPVRLPRDAYTPKPRQEKVSLAPGKEIELYELKFKLRPAGENGDEDNATESADFAGTVFTFYGAGKFLIQYERLIEKPWAGPEPDPTLSKLATGKLELEIKSDPPPATEKKSGVSQEVSDRPVLRNFTVTGTVTDAQDKPLDGVVVNIFRKAYAKDAKQPRIEEFGMTKTNSAGGFEIKSLYPAWETDARSGFLLKFSAPGFAPTSLFVDKVFDPKKKIKIILEPEKDKEAINAWGKEVGGLQAGLACLPDERRVYHHGEMVTLVVWVRNVGKEEAKFQYLYPVIEHQPTVTDGDGKPIPQPNDKSLGARRPLEVNLAPGKAIVIHELKRQIRPANESDNKKDSTLYGTGNVSVRYEQVLGDPSQGLPGWKLDPVLSRLATGKLELEIKSETPASWGGGGFKDYDATGKLDLEIKSEPPAATEIALQAGEGKGGDAAQDSGAEKLYREMEEKCDAKSLRVALDGEVDSQSLKGTVKATIYATQGNKSRMEIDFEIGGNSNKQLFITDGKARYTKQGDKVTLDANPKKEVEKGKLIARIGITGAMMMARAVKQGEEEKEIDLGKDAPVTNFKLGAKEMVGDSTAQVVTYQLDFNGKSAQISVWIDTKTQLPLKRVVAVNQDGQMFRITETYGTFAIDPKLEPKLFEIPKE